MFRRQAYYIASAAFVILTLVYFIAIINQTYVGLDLTDVNGQWIVASSDPNGEGYKLGIHVGDRILRINNQDTGEYRFVKKWSQAEGASTIESRRMGQPTDNLINISKRPDLLMLLNEIPMFVLGLIFWILGFIAWRKRPFSVQARALFWLNWFMGLAIVLAPASSRDLIFARELEYITLSSVSILLITFVSVFPRHNKNRVNLLGRLTLTFTSVVIFILTVLQSIGIVHFNSPLKKLVLLSLIIGILIMLWNLGMLIKLPNDKPEKNQVNIVLLGMAIGFLPFVSLTAVPVIFNFQPIVNTEVSYLFISAIPATLYYVIVHKYLPDSRRILERLILFLVMGLIINFVISYALFFLRVVKTLNLKVYLATLALSMPCMVCFSLIRIVINKLLQKFVFSEELQGYKKRVLKLNERLTSINEEDRILEEVMRSLAIEGAFIVVENSKGGYFKNSVGRFLVKPSEQAKLEELFHSDQKINLEPKILSDDFPAEIYIPFVSNDFNCGIFLGHRYSHVKVERDELPLIKLISSQLAQRLKTTFIIETLSKDLKDLAKNSRDTQRRNIGLQGLTTSLLRSLEKEKKIIAREIHDGPLQLGMDLDRRLKNLVEEGPIDNKTLKAVSHMQELVEDLSIELRLICNDLRPPALSDLGLLPAIELMCEEIMLNELLLISLETVGISREERFDEEAEIAAYRFLQEGIANVVKHSGSSKLKIHIEVNESRIELSIKDTGRGFNTSKIDDWSLTSVHFGIVGMKERMESLGGNLQISSTIGRGTILKATIPVIIKSFAK